jgi:hypothetical protein
MSSDHDYQELVRAFRSVDSQIEEAETLLENTVTKIRNLKEQRKFLVERGLSGRRPENAGSVQQDPLGTGSLATRDRPLSDATDGFASLDSILDIDPSVLDGSQILGLFQDS